MTKDQAKDIAKTRLLDYVEANLEPSPNSEKGKWCCPCPGCNSGHGENKSGAFSVKGDMWKCFSCNNSGDIFDLYEIVKHTSGKDTFDGVYKWCGLTIDEPSQPDRWTPVAQPEPDYDYAPEDYEAAPEDYEAAPEDYEAAPEDTPSYSKGEGVVYFITDDNSFGEFMAACSAIGGAKALSERDTKTVIENRNAADAFVFCVDSESARILESTIKDDGATVLRFTTDELAAGVESCVKAGVAKAKAIKTELARLKAEQLKEAAKQARSAIEFVKSEGIYKKPEESIFVLNELLADKAKLMCEAGYPTITVSDFLTLTQGNDFFAGVIFASESSQDKTIGDKTELDYLCERAKKLNLPVCAMTDFESILNDWNGEENGRFKSATELAYSNLNDIKVNRDRLNKSFAEIDEQILNHDTNHFYTATFGKGISFEVQNMIVIVARSGTGKTVALNSICIEALEARKRVILLTLEEPENQMVIHLVLRRYARLALKNGTETLETLNDRNHDPSSEAYIAWKKDAKGEPLTEKEFALKKAKDFIAKKMKSGALHIGIHENVAEMTQYLRYTAKEGDIVLIDYQQLIKPIDTELVHDKFAKVAQVSKELAKIAKDRRIILIVAAQANRGAVGTTDAQGWRVENLEQDTVKDSDEIFQDAGVVVAIGAEKGKSDDNQRRFFRQLKNRLAPEDSRLLEMEHALGYSYIRAMRDEDGSYVVFKSHAQQVAEAQQAEAEEKKQAKEAKKRAKEKPVDEMTNAELVDYFFRNH